MSRQTKQPRGYTWADFAAVSNPADKDKTYRERCNDDSRMVKEKRYDRYAGAILVGIAKKGQHHA